jgi:hypothetical protein
VSAMKRIIQPPRAGSAARITCLAATTAALAGLAVSVGLGCRGDGSPKPSASEPPPPATQPPQPAAQLPQPAAPTAPPSAAYARDIEKLCDVVRLSGAERESPEDRRLPIANWLAANLTTAESRKFLVQIQPLGGDRKADALEAEARRVGLSGCNLAAEWRSPPTP